MLSSTWLWRLLLWQLILNTASSLTDRGEHMMSTLAGGDHIMSTLAGGDHIMSTLCPPGGCTHQVALL